MPDLGKRRIEVPSDITIPLPRIGSEPQAGWIEDYYRRLRLASVFPLDATDDGELQHLKTWWASRRAAPRLALTAGSQASTDSVGGQIEIGMLVPRLPAGTEPLGEYQGSGLAEATYLVRHPGGQVVHLSRLLYLVLSAIDGTRTVSEIADRVTVGFGRTVSVSNIEYLLVRKLDPLGLLATEDMAAAAAAQPPRQARSLLALKLRRTLVPEAGVQYLALIFRPLFSPFVVALMLASLIASDAWLFGSGRIGSAFQYVLLHPGLLLLVIGLSVLSMLFHECGHAAACRYGGARPGVIGVGFYVIYPAFFTNVTDAYRLGRAGRIRTDLGGVYFNAIFVLALAAAYRATGYAPLAAAVLLIHVEIVQQLLPSLRFDGYFILADLIGIPDLFRRIGPALLSLVPGRPADPRVSGLKRPARVALIAWVLVIVPLLATELGLIVLNAPHTVRIAAGSLRAQVHAAATQFEHADVAAGLLYVIAALMLVLPLAGISYILLRMARTVIRKTIVATRPRRVLRIPAAAAALLIAAGLAYHWGVLPLPNVGAVLHPSAAGQATVRHPDPARSAPADPPHRVRESAAMLKPVSAAGFDALEGRHNDPSDENTATAKYAIDGNPATAWSTQYYVGSPFFGGLKKGTGLILDMGKQVRLSSITVTFGPSRGADVSIEVGNDDTLAAATLSQFTTVATADDVGGTHTFHAVRAARGRYVLIWFTKLPPLGSHRFAAEIFNIVVRGHPASSFPAP
jgi:putative peptide zinc metalloprotease protein